MKLRLGLVTLLVVAISISAAANKGNKRSDAKAQVAFGIQIALKSLWRDATTRFEMATAIDPLYSSAWNNVAIGYEQLGRFDEAKKAYERALRLDPKDEYIKSNYQEFRLVYDRTNSPKSK